MDVIDAQGCADHNVDTVRIGRPTKYKPEYCDKVLELGKDGYFIYQIAKELHVATMTLYHWERDHEDFLYALTRARELALSFWETFALSHLESRDFQSKLYEFIIRSKTEGMQASTVNLPSLRSAKNYTDKCEIIIGAVAEGMITVLQAQTLINIVSSAAKVEEITELKDKLKKIEDFVASKERPNENH